MREGEPARARWVRWIALPVALLAASGARPTRHAGVQEAGARAFACTSIGTTPVRTWTFTPKGDAWQVAHGTSGESATQRLVLPNVRVTLSRDEVHLRSRTANGGIDVTLAGPWAGATLDAYVNYELEVNVDSSLSPDIDHIATPQPVGVRCELL